MINVSTPLSDDEMEYLDQFLLGRIDEDAYDEDKNEGVLDVSELDGLLAAIISGPEMIQPSRWLPLIWGDFEPVWESEKEFEKIFSLIIRHMNAMADIFMAHPQDFEPLFYEREVKGKTYTIVDEWCQGYMQGVSLTMDKWEIDSLEMRVMLMPIKTFANEEGWQALDKMDDNEIENLQNAIVTNVREIHAWWLARRQDMRPSSSPVYSEFRQVGRNDLCPCGSGKKYKKCCLH